MNFAGSLSVLSLIVLVLEDCAVQADHHGHVKAVCHMEPDRRVTNPSPRVTGKITFFQQTKQSPTRISVRLRGLTPNTVHGFHIHNSGDVISKGCQSCGPHFKPDGTTHAGPRDKTRHIGDLGNVMSDGKGNVQSDFFDYMVSLLNQDSVIGRSIVIHALRDDLGRGKGPARPGSLKTGNAGRRLACCSIVHV